MNDRDIQVHESNGGTAHIDIVLVIHKVQLQQLTQHSERRKETITHIASVALREWIERENFRSLEGKD